MRSTFSSSPTFIPCHMFPCGRTSLTTRASTGQWLVQEQKPTVCLAAGSLRARASITGALCSSNIQQIDLGNSITRLTATGTTTAVDPSQAFCTNQAESCGGVTTQITDTPHLAAACGWWSTMRRARMERHTRCFSSSRAQTARKPGSSEDLVRTQRSSRMRLLGLSRSPQ